MPRALKGAARRQSRKRWFNRIKGMRGSRNVLWSRAKESAYRAGVNAYRDRRLVKRDYRKLWITRIGAACKMRDMSYSRFINGLKLANIALNRKMLSEIAIHDEAAFDKLVELAKAARETEQAQGATA